MIKPIQMYTVICDNCGKRWIDENTGFIGFEDSHDMESNVENADWITHLKKHYCNECFLGFNNNDNLVLKEIKETK